MVDNLAQKIEEFFADQKAKTYKRGEILIYPNEEVTKILYIREGFLRDYAVAPSGEEVTIHFFQKGSFLPLTSVIGGFKHRYYLASLGQSKVVEVDIDAFNKFLDQHPALYKDILIKMLGAVDGLTLRIEHMAFSNSLQKIANTIIFLDKHFGMDINGTRGLKYKFTHKEIASFATLTRETTSRELSSLKTRGLITLDNKRIFIEDADALKKLAG